MHRPALAAILLGSLLATACGGPASDGNDDRPLVVTTVSPITSIAANIAGRNARIHGIVPEGTNSHTFEPAPSVAEVLTDADVVFLNGLELEVPVARLAERHASDATVVELGNEVLPRDEWIFDFSFPEEDGKPNPHLWTDPTYALRYAEVIRDTLVELDPGSAREYRRNFEEFEALVAELDEAMRESFETVPPDRRKLLTYHDAYAYFADTYGWEVIGAVQVRDFDDPSPREVANLIEQIRAQQVPAIFGSEVFPSPVLDRIADEAGVRYVDDLRDDDLPGRPGDPEHSWLGLMKFNFATIVSALGADAAPIEAVRVRNVAPDDAVYPQ